jgi:sterol desaturase/sphingolipid hydroxylase (fatty acid hydroxylase superfamily)
MVIVFAAFCVLGVAAFCRADGPSRVMSRTGAEWLADASGLVIQGIGVPFAQTALIYAGLMKLSPSLHGCISLSPLAAFLLNFAGVDYLYYWNHRMLHGKLWPWHALHHSATDMDVWITSRNTLWTPLLIVYIWINGVMVFLLKDPSAYLLAAAATAALDLWRHSGAWPSSWRLPVLMTPREHSWHHSSERFNKNFGANFRLWDKMHGTHYDPQVRPERLGLEVPGGILRAVVLPSR